MFSAAVDYYFSKREKLPYTLSPDADYPLINLEKGRYAPKFSKKAQSTGERTVTAFSGGTTGNIVPCKASVTLSGIKARDIIEEIKKAEERTGVVFSTEENETLTVSALGVSSHAAHPENGSNAQTALISLINSLPLTDNEVTRSFKALEKLFPHNETDGSSVGIRMSDELSGALTLNFGVLHFKDGVFTGSLDMRCPMCADEENVKKVIDSRLEECGFTVENCSMVPVHYVPEDSPIIKTALGVYEEYTGNKGYCLSIGGGTYVHDIDGGVAFGIEFPGTDYRIHGADEFAVVNELLLTAKMYTAIIYELCY